MKKSITVIILLFSLSFYAQKYIYFTEKFKELPSAEGVTYYNTYENVKEGTQKKTCFLDGTLRNSDFFSNYRKRIKNGVIHNLV